jgi:hypothetical protein
MNVQVVIPPYCIGEDELAILPNKAMLPNGPLMVASLLRGKGCRLQATDLVFRRNWKDYLPSTQPETVLLSCHTVRNIPACIAVLDEMRRGWTHNKTNVVLGGNVCLDFGVEQFSKMGLEADAVIRGWGHSPDVVENIMSGYKGDIWPKEYSALPLPDTDLIPANIHQSYWSGSEFRYSMYGFVTGCRWYRSCGVTYCKADMDSPLRERPMDDSVRELDLAKALGYREIWCVDNLLFTNPELAIRFDREVAERGMVWAGMTRPELVCKLSTDFFSQFKALREVAMGVETASELLLQVLQRGAKANYQQTIAEAFAKVHSGKIATNAFVMLDLPGSTESDFWQLYELLKSICPKTISWSFYNPQSQTVLGGQHQPEQMGFYRWPLGYSQVMLQRTVQQAMILSGTWWDGLVLDERDTFFEDDEVFGVNFLETQLFQGKTARSPIGDLWEAWRTDERRRL